MEEEKNNNLQSSWGDPVTRFSINTGLLWTSDKESRQSEKALRNEGREPAEFTKCVRTNTTCIYSKQLNHLTNETNKSPDAVSDFLLINKPFFLKALAQSKPAKWEKWRVRSRGWTLLSKPGRGSEQHYGQNEKKMLYCVGNKSQLWHVMYCFPPTVWLHLNKYTLTLSCTHTHMLGQLHMARWSRASNQQGPWHRTQGELPCLSSRQWAPGWVLQATKAQPWKSPLC